MKLARRWQSAQRAPIGSSRPTAIPAGEGFISLISNISAALGVNLAASREETPSFWYEKMSLRHDQKPFALPKNSGLRRMAGLRDQSGDEPFNREKRGPVMEPQNSTLPEFGEEINGPGVQFFDNVVLDNIWESMLELTAAVWTYRDRMIVLEKVLQDTLGPDKDISALIEAYEPTPEDKKQRESERTELVSTVFRSFSRRAGVAPVDSQHALTPGETEEV